MTKYSNVQLSVITLALIAIVIVIVNDYFHGLKEDFTHVFRNEGWIPKSVAQISAFCSL
jgi:hypothetical protein